jgi:hypothetical protein
MRALHLSLNGDASPFRFDYMKRPIHLGLNGEPSHVTSWDTKLLPQQKEAHRRK